jgi:hypothetical protein
MAWRITLAGPGSARGPSCSASCSVAVPGDREDPCRGRAAGSFPTKRSTPPSAARRSAAAAADGAGAGPVLCAGTGAARSVEPAGAPPAPPYLPA